MPRDNIYCEVPLRGMIDPPVRGDNKRRQQYFSCSQSLLWKPFTWKYILLVPVIAVIFIYMSSTPKVDDGNSISVRRYPIPKSDIIDSNQFSTKSYRIAIHYFNKYKKLIENKRYLTVIDYSKPSYSKRMAIIDLKTHAVEKHLVAHGKNSGVFYASDFSNQMNSLKSCRGAFLTGAAYFGIHGRSLHLLGLERGVNDRAFDRGIVIHGADYVSRRSMVVNGGYLGRSWGCPAVPLNEVDGIIDRIRDGSFLYIHSTS